MRGKSKSTKELIGVSAFSENGLISADNRELVFFLVQPNNISVLSEDGIGQKITELTQLLSGFAEIELLCVDARENFDANKLYLSERLMREEKQAVARLLQEDRKFLDNIQLKMSTSREFLFALRLPKGREEQNFSILNRAGKQIAAHGFSCRMAKRRDIKRILTRFFGWNLPDEYMEDYDGESAVRKWIIPDEERRGNKSYGEKKAIARG